MTAKLKTHKGCAKRIKITKKGKLKYRSCGRGHLLTSKTSKRKRSLRKSRTLKKTDQIGSLKKLLPYG